MDENTSGDQSGRPPGNKPAWFIVVLVVVLLLFGAIDILPLHYGSASLPWPEVWLKAKEKLPRTMLIAAAVAGFLVLRSRVKTGGPGEREKETER